ncbi:hypothetical protein B005_4812 [Nocardiopsis alba ATCC BAA-2165]|uniref:Uncharacterized protein n=1 Tax=Nocardiopsis alba (strain ATCC BAA-2165 / BE74) TaxID=1205910 RepID=J7LFM3_NOCAA|nr:hypothetical protein B005_4812 [Nocardiopsis alba ATCC BAA-2165]
MVELSLMHDQVPHAIPGQKPTQQITVRLDDPHEEVPLSRIWSARPL